MKRPASDGSSGRRSSHAPTTRTTGRATPLTQTVTCSASHWTAVRCNNSPTARATITLRPGRRMAGASPSDARAPARPITRLAISGRRTQTAATQAQATSRSSAPIVAFFSAKGGSGVSTLAVNTAAALSAKYPKQVLLIDLSAPFGHAALFADLVATGSIAGASKAAPADFEKNLRGAIVYHKTGLGVLPGTLRPEQVDLMNADLTGRALDAAAGWHRIVLADLGTSLAEAALVVIERAERLVVVVPPEMAAMADARRALAIFRDIMNVPDNRLELVLNNRVPGAPLDRNGVEATLGHKMSLTVNFDDTRPEDAALAGSLVLQRDPSSQVSRGSNELARLIVGKLKLDG